MTFCKLCGKYFKPEGMASHRAMHRRKGGKQTPLMVCAHPVIIDYYNGNRGCYHCKKEWTFDDNSYLRTIAKNVKKTLTADEKNDEFSHKESTPLGKNSTFSSKPKKTLETKNV